MNFIFIQSNSLEPYRKWDVAEYLLKFDLWANTVVVRQQTRLGLHR